MEKKFITNLKETKIYKIFMEVIPYIVILVIVLLIRIYLVTPIIVSGESMLPTLDGGELMVLNKIDKIERFDIVVVDTGKEEIIKRVIAVPGETISCENGIIYINGHRQDEEYSRGITSDFEKIKLEDDEFFVMGDNREDSLDSRHMGPFKRTAIKGTAKLVLFPFSEIGFVE